MSEPMDPRRDQDAQDSHGEWDALAVGWALSALDPEDSELFAAPLPGCARCTATVRESLYTVVDLAYALPDAAPPAGMKSRLMAAVAGGPRPAAAPAAPAPDTQWPLGEPHPGTPGYDVDWFAKNQPAANNEPFPRADGAAAQLATEEPAERTTEIPPQIRPSEQPSVRELGRPERDGPIRVVQQPIRGRHSAMEEVAFPGGDEPAVVVPLESRRRSRLRVAASAVAVAAVIAVIAALGAGNLNLRSQPGDLRPLVAQREAALPQQTANEPARVAALVDPKKPADPREATVVVRGNQIEIIVETLGATPSDGTYWLWTLNCDGGLAKARDLKPVRGFTVTQSAFSVRDIGSDADAATATCFAISLEPGTATPAGPTDVRAAGQPRV